MVLSSASIPSTSSVWPPLSAQSRTDLPCQIAVFVKASLHPPYGVASEVIVVDMSRLSKEGTEQREGRRGHGEQVQSQKMDGGEIW